MHTKIGMMKNLL